MRTIMDMGEWGGLPREQNGCSDPGIIADQKTGEIFCFAVWMHGNPNHHHWLIRGTFPGYEIGQAAQFLMVRSRDDGRTWSQPENLTRQLKRFSWWLIAPAPTQGIQLQDGTLVMPLEGRDENGNCFATIMSSRNHGDQWTVGSPVPWGSECAAAELGDGSIMLNMRNRNDDTTTQYRRIAVTDDLGRTWRPHATNLNTLIEPTCNASLLRVDYDENGAKKHILLFENPHRHANRDRSHHTLQVSFDDGRTWPREFHLALDDGFGWGYPCLTRLDARHIAVLYAGSQADLQFQVLSLDEILHRPAAH
jgi:sialidase-1